MSDLIMVAFDDEDKLRAALDAGKSSTHTESYHVKVSQSTCMSRPATDGVLLCFPVVRG